MKRVAIDAETGCGFDLNVIAKLHDVADQLVFHLSDNFFVKVAGIWPAHGNALANKIGGHAFKRPGLARLVGLGKNSLGRWRALRGRVGHD